MATTDPTSDVTGAVYSQLSKDHSSSAIAWVPSAFWRGPTALSDLDAKDVASWPSTPEDQAKIDAFAERIKGGEELPPVVVVQVNQCFGPPQRLVVDGRHRYRAHKQVGIVPQAYVGEVSVVSDRDWTKLPDEMHLAQGAGAVAPVPAPERVSPALGSTVQIAGLPEGRVLALSLSGTERTDWKVMLGGALLTALGVGFALGRAARPTAREQHTAAMERKRKMRELARRT